MQKSAEVIVATIKEPSMYRHRSEYSRGSEGLNIESSWNSDRNLRIAYA